VLLPKSRSFSGGSDFGNSIHFLFSRLGNISLKLEYFTVFLLQHPKLSTEYIVHEFLQVSEFERDTVKATVQARVQHFQEMIRNVNILIIVAESPVC
jgi:hypothetical protein